VSLSKCTARLGHLEKGTSRLGTATGGNTQRHKPRADTFWGMLWAFGGWEFVGVVMGVGGWGAPVQWDSCLRKKVFQKKTIFHQTYLEKRQFRGRRSVRIKKMHNNKVVEDRKGYRSIGVYF